MQKLYKIGYFVIITVLVIIAATVLASILPIPGKLEIKIVQSGSMEPTIKTGSIVIIRPASAYKAGDIVTFGKDTKAEVPTTHRIVADRVENGVLYYTTKGDANEDNDTKEIKKEEIVGKVIFSVPFMGYVIDFAKRPAGFAIIIGLPAACVIYDEVKKIFVEIKKIKTKKEDKAEQ